jgi:putative protease
MGAYMGGRHPNHGDCPQPCRYKYRIAPLQDGSDKQGEWIDAEESENGLYLLNSRDLCTIDILPRILATGVHSLKIEGRNKSIHYVASVVKTYRAALDACLSDPENYHVRDEWRQSFESVEHRPYTTGFLAGETMLQEVFSSKASSGSRVLGIVKGLIEGGIPVIDVKNSFSAGDALEVLPVQQSLSPYPVTFTSLSDLAGNPVQRAPSSRLVLGHGAQRLRVGDMFRVVTSKSCSD